MYSEKMTFKDLIIGAVYGKEEEVDQRPGIVIIFENLVEIRALLIYIDWHRIEKHGKTGLFGSMNFLSINDD